VQYRHEVQITRMRALYGDGDRMTLQEAAALAGFGSYSQFHRVYTRLCGHPPREHARRTSGAGEVPDDQPAVTALRGLPAPGRS
jgi:AraC-like DNA-binding protein